MFKLSFVILCLIMPVSGVESGEALPSSGVQGLSFQEVTVTPSGSFWSMPSQYTPPSLVSPTLVKMVFLQMVVMALGLVLAEVPGATPKKPFSGLMALRLPAEADLALSPNITSCVCLTSSSGAAYTTNICLNGLYSWILT